MKKYELEKLTKAELVEHYLALQTENEVTDEDINEFVANEPAEYYIGMHRQDGQRYDIKRIAVKGGIVVDEELLFNRVLKPKAIREFNELAFFTYVWKGGKAA